MSSSKFPAALQGRAQPARNGNAARCDHCGAPLTPRRGSRRQRYCGSICRKSANRAKKFAARYRTPGAGRSVKNNPAKSATCKPIISGRGSLPINILGGHRWPGSRHDAIAALIRNAIDREIGEVVAEIKIPPLDAEQTKAARQQLREAQEHLAALSDRLRGAP